MTSCSPEVPVATGAGGGGAGCCKRTAKDFDQSEIWAKSEKLSK